jgi:enoyl-CoA hydratase/carnithine racemase
MGTIEMYRDGAVARLVIDNLPRNYLTTAMFEQLGHHVQEIEADPDLLVAVIHGTATTRPCSGSAACMPSST